MKRKGRRRGVGSIPIPFLPSDATMPDTNKKRRLPADPSTSSPTSGEDRLSDLPDTLRLHILGFLPFKYAIRTGVLSSRWRGLWSYRWPQPSSLYLSSSSSSSDSSFAASVDRCFSLRGCRRMDSLSLSFHRGQALSADLLRWLDYAAACAVADLHIDLHPPPSSSSVRRGPRRYGPVDVSSLVFGSVIDSPLIVRLTLRGFHLSASPISSLNMGSSLQVLNLYDISITDAALRKIVFSCPVLLSLDVRCCRDLRHLAISSPRLTSLAIVDCPKASGLAVSSNSGLHSFRFSGVLLSSYCLNDTSKLKDVYLSSPAPGSALPRSNLASVFGALSNVKEEDEIELPLCQYIAVSGAKAIEDLSNFPSLTELELLMMMMTDSNLADIYGFFRLCRFPRLEKLFIELPTSMRDPFVEKYLEVVEEESPDDGLENIRMIKMNSFKGHYNEMRLVRFLLEKASRLDSLIIVAPQDHHLKSEKHCRNGAACQPNVLDLLRLQLSCLTKASENAQIILSGDDDYPIRPTHSQVYLKV
ncbi:putative FBD-associated F-box protein At5g53635 isoform X1 [Typha latifolia]|uniref:putative FBD-associated F-box protein At5g53635 isoform X1 n=1 Tax=Typha latifolia TaxID=4733 RepID=UPI003C30C045